MRIENSGARNRCRSGWTTSGYALDISTTPGTLKTKFYPFAGQKKRPVCRVAWPPTGVFEAPLRTRQHKTRVISSVTVKICGSPQGIFELVNVAQVLDLMFDTVFVGVKSFDIFNAGGIKVQATNRTVVFIVKQDAAIPNLIAHVDSLRLDNFTHDRLDNVVTVYFLLSGYYAAFLFRVIFGCLLGWGHDVFF